MTDPKTARRFVTLPDDVQVRQALTPAQAAEAAKTLLVPPAARKPAE